MEKEEKVIVILLSMVFLSLFISYFVFFESGSEISVFSSSSVNGDDAFIEGTVISKRMTYSGDHLILMVDSLAGPVKVFVPCDNGANEIDSLLVVDSEVRISGKVDEYGGEIELVVQKVDDVIVL